MGSIIGYGALAVVFLPAVQRRWRPWVVGALATLVALIGFSRIGLGVHYLTDVIGGFVLGAAWLMASVAAFEVWRVERGRRPVEHPLTEGVEPEAGKDLKPDLASTGEKERA
jgi:undecaprenyl-diphosphatase